MHPNPKFRWDDEAALRAFVSARGFAQICVIAEGAPLLAHAPLCLMADGAPAFHLARANPAMAHLDGAAVAASVIADDHYVSPDWYAAPANEVPTWNYRAVEIYGRARRLGEAELRDQLDALAAAQEAKLAPKQPWTNAKVEPRVMEAMLGAIVGFAIEEARFVGTDKFGQNKSAADRAGVAAALAGMGA